MRLTIYMGNGIYTLMTPSAEVVFGALAHETRLRLLVLLQQEGELCVCELMHAVGAAQPTVSRHLAELRRLGLVAARRQGQWIYYRLHPQLPEWIKRVVAATVLGVAQQAPFTEDRAALESMSGRPAAGCCG